MSISNLPLTPPKAVLFDWDETLAETWAVIFAATNDTLQAMGHPVWTESEARVRVAKSLRDSFPVLFGDDWEKAAEIFYAAFARHHLAALKTKAGAEDLLRSLRDIDLPMGVISNKTGNYLRAEIDHLGWHGYFTGVCGAGDAPADKPDPAVMGHTLDLMGIRNLLESDPASVWYVGDRPIDLELARRTGGTAVLLEDPKVVAGSAKDAPDAWVSSLPDVKLLVFDVLKIISV